MHFENLIRAFSPCLERQIRGALVSQHTTDGLKARVTVIVLALLAITAGCSQFNNVPAAKHAPTSWPQANEILKRIKAPTFPGRKFPITDYGAVAGSDSDASEAIRKAIAACNKAGGGHVIVPA